MRTISLKVPDAIDAQLEARSRDLGKTESELTREALARFLDTSPAPGVSCLDLVRDLVGVARGPRSGVEQKAPARLRPVRTRVHPRHRAARRARRRPGQGSPV